MMLLRRFMQDERGATAVEYGLIVAVLSLVVVAGVSTFSGRLQVLLGTDIVGKLDTPN